MCGGLLLLCLAAVCVLPLRALAGRCLLIWLSAPGAVLCLALFLLFWETSPRYITNYLPLLLLSAALAFAPARSSE